ncbi:FAD-binding oxidoreductase [Nonomuraea dietziae]|uniref:FAD/FMN-containing dehydrogenase n=1 Tax=Nonomuraea dietziae TaxID=65515 RepID=A0A7W5Y5S6_9ACTN|nr:FAD-dependent oxidoreductase [Nonomuraea dietziae]MBB3725691.1 FAD/FMN-containing dehydrogenase [Nonomuraea dietziae]
MNDILRERVEGAVHAPGDERYEAERRPWNRLVDHRPAVVVEAAGPGDVRAALLTAREREVPFAVQSTGHGTLVPTDGGVLVKTTPMASVRVDPERRTARVGAGAIWSDVITAAAPYGLAPVSGTPAIGVAGYTLGGGAGWLSRLHGYAADNLIGAEVVTAEGHSVTVSADEHPELFWALRGGGGNFAVVTSLEFRLHPVGRVHAGMALFPFERAADTLARYREWALTEPDELNTSVILMRMPGRGWVLAVRAFCVDGGEHALESLLEVAGPSLGGEFATMSFAEAATAFGGPPPPPMAVLQHIDLLEQVSDEAIDTIVKSADGTLTAIEVRHWGGAMARPEPGAGPVGHRRVPFSVIATSVLDGSDEREQVEGDQREVARALRPHAMGGTFLNFLYDPSRTATAYTAADHARLAEVKREWDPGNVLGRSHNIAPASGSPRGRSPSSTP